MKFSKSRNFQLSILWKASLLSILASLLLIAVDQLSMRVGLDGSQRIADDLLGGLIAGAIFSLYERRRLRRLSEQLEVIDLMNHHIRNALQPLILMQFGPEMDSQMKLVEDCARRIDWTLREVLPGKSKGQFVTARGEFTGRSDLENQSSAVAPSSEPIFKRWLDGWESRAGGKA